MKKVEAEVKVKGVIDSPISTSTLALTLLPTALAGRPVMAWAGRELHDPAAGSETV